MEKDYFKDRPEECQLRSYFLTGNEAFICLKSAQKTAIKLSDLTRIEITGLLTSQSKHPRGIKLRGTAFERDLFGNISVNQELVPIQSEAVGRCTYPMCDGNVLTSSGLKSIVFSEENGLFLASAEQIGERYNLSVVFETQTMQFECVFNPYCYYSTDELPAIVDLVQLENALTDGRFLYTYYNSMPIAAPIRGISFRFSHISSVNAAFEIENPNFSRFIKAEPISYCGIRE